MKIESKTSETGANGRTDENASSAAISPLNGARSAVTSEFHNALADIEYLIKDAAQLTGDDLARTTVKITEHIATARKSVEALGDTFAERAQQTIATTTDYVQKQPWKAIGIGAAVGLVLSALLTRRA